MKLYPFVLLALTPAICKAQSMKRDTISGVVVYTGHSDARHIAKGNFHTYTTAATAIRTDTGYISIRTEFGYIDLGKNYEFIPMGNLQPARLKRTP